MILVIDVGNTRLKWAWLTSIATANARCARRYSSLQHEAP